jgi:hypothetical protein
MIDRRLFLKLVSLVTAASGGTAQARSSEFVLERGALTRFKRSHGVTMITVEADGVYRIRLHRRVKILIDPRDSRLRRGSLDDLEAAVDTLRIGVEGIRQGGRITAMKIIIFEVPYSY